MKILFIADGVHPSTSGGIQTFGRTLKKIFKENLSFIDIMEPPKNKKIFKVDDVEILFSYNIILKLIFKVFRERLKIDIGGNLLGRRIGKLNHDLYILRSPKNLRLLHKKDKKVLYQHINIENLINSKSYFNNEIELIEIAKTDLDYFVTPSPKDRLLAIEKLGLAKDKVICIRHCCEIDVIDSYKKKNKNLIMVCRLENNQKRIDLAIKAMAKLTDFHLNIYGDGKDRNKLEKLRDEMELNNITFHGRTNKVKEVLDENSIFVMTSDYEGYGITNVEAMRRGLPIVLRNTFEAASDIVNGNGVLLDELWDEKKYVQAIYDTYENYEKYSLKSIELGHRHDFKIIMNKWRQLVDNLENKKVD